MALRVALVLAIAALGCGIAFPYPRANPIPDYSAALTLAHNMNRDVLTHARFDRIVVEIDWVEGAAPAESALSELATFLRKYVPPTFSAEIRRSDEIKRAAWTRNRQGSQLLGLARDHADEWPSPDTRSHSLYVLYVPETPQLSAERYGVFLELADPQPEPVTQSERRLPVIIIAKEPIRGRALLWIGADAVERTILVHEAGHFLGLVSNADHRQRSGAHCTNPRCPMQHGVWRAALANFYRAVFTGRLPTELGAECRDDIALAKAIWAGADLKQGVELPPIRSRVRDPSLNGPASHARFVGD